MYSELEKLEGLYNEEIIFFLVCLLLFVISINMIIHKFIFNNLNLYEYIRLSSNFNIIHVRNFGAAFNFLSDNKCWQKFFLIFISFFVCIFLLKSVFDQYFNDCIVNIPYILIIIGSFCNSLDRLMYGYVIDFFDFHIENWHFPIFNVNDILICLGCFLCIIKNIYKNFNKCNY